MPVRRPLVLAILIILGSGCMGEGQVPGETEPDDGVARSSKPNVDVGSESEPVPDLEPGSAWTYTTGGYWDTVPSLTIVLAQRDASGFLFAAAAEAELDDEIAWDLPYLGRADDRLRGLEDEKYGGGVQDDLLLDFPLESGKTWNYYDVQVTARPANVTALGKAMEGWAITGEDDDRRVTIEYAPSVGYISRFEDYSKHLEQPVFSLALTAVSRLDAWVWIERGHEVVTHGTFVGEGSPTVAPAEVLEATADDSIVFVWALGSTGSRGGVTSPQPGEPWTFEGAGVPNVKKAALPAAPGKWSVVGVNDPAEGFVYIQAHAIKWVTSA